MGELIGEAGDRASRVRSWLWRRADEPLDPSVRAAMTRFRVMATIVGCALLLACFVGIPVQLKDPKSWVVLVLWTGHGYLYLIYLAVGYDLARRGRWGIGRILLVVCAGFVPGLAFVVEASNRRHLEAELAAQSVI